MALRFLFWRETLKCILVPWTRKSDRTCSARFFHYLYGTGCPVLSPGGLLSILFSRQGYESITFCLTLIDLSQSLCYLYNIDIFQYVTQNSTWTRQNTIYCIIFEVDVGLKVTLIGQLHQSPGCSVGTASGYKFQGVGSIPAFGSDFYFVFCCSRRAPGRSTGPIQMVSSMTFIRGNRCRENDHLREKWRRY